MKPTKKFKDSFQQTLNETGFWTSQQGSAQTWNPSISSPPYKGMTGAAGYGTQNLLSDEQELTKDCDISVNLPFPLGNINEYLANIYIDLSKTETSIKSCIEQNAVVTGEKRKFLEAQLKEIRDIKVQIKEVSKNIEKLSLNV